MRIRSKNNPIRTGILLKNGLQSRKHNGGEAVESQLHRLRYDEWPWKRKDPEIVSYQRPNSESKGSTRLRFQFQQSSAIINSIANFDFFDQDSDSVCRSREI